jgi:cytochrome c1
VGSKRDRAWLDAEVIDPASHQPDTKMPAHELSRAELAALVSYLMSLK